MKNLLFVCLLILFSTVALAANHPVPLINQPLVPSSVAPGSAGFNLIVNGTGFAAGAVVDWNGSPRTTIIISHSQLKAQITATDVATRGTAAITVVNPGPGGGTSNVVYFPVHFGSPTVALARRDHAATDMIAGEGITIGDFNNDGIVDVAIGSSTGVDVLLGNGNGTFQAPITSAAGIRAVALQAADLNGDGKLDLLILDGEGNGQVLLGNGNGTLSALTPVTFSPNSEFMAIGDLNGDGILDLITVGEDEGTFSFDSFLGNGDGTFSLKQTVSLVLGLGNPALGDFNGDGKLDLAVPDIDANGNSVVDVFLGNGDGTFQGLVAYQTSFFNQAVVAADVNGDGKLDLITDGVSVLLGNGDGTFTSVGGTAATATSSVSLALAVADMNSDGKQDVILGPRGGVSNSGGVNSVLVLLGNGDGTFQTPLTWTTGNQLSPGLGIADFNRDGRLDVVDVDVDAISGTPGFSVFLQSTLNVSPTFMNFGTQTQGTTSSSQTATLTNDSSTTLSLSPMKLAGANSSSYGMSTTCGSTLASGASCTVSVTFSPKTKATRTATVQITSGAVGSPVSIELTGVGD